MLFNLFLGKSHLNQFCWNSSINSVWNGIISYYCSGCNNTALSNMYPRQNCRIRSNPHTIINNNIGIIFCAALLFILFRILTNMLSDFICNMVPTDARYLRSKKDVIPNHNFCVCCPQQTS